MEIKINEVIRNKRHSLNVSQEVLAERLGVTVQAVSKWETGLSCPDIAMLPLIAEYFDMSIDALFFGEEFEGSRQNAEGNVTAVLDSKDIPDDGKLRVVQCLGRKVLAQGEYSEDKKFRLIIPKTEDQVLNFEVWGNAEIDGDIGGNATAGNAMTCSDVGRNATAGMGIACADIGGNVIAGQNITCSDIGGNVKAGQNVTCCDIGGNADAGGDIRCGEIGGNADAGKNTIVINE